MAASRLEDEPLDCLIATKVNRSDREALQKLVEQGDASQAAIVRLAVRQFLSAPQSLMIVNSRSLHMRKTV